MQTQIDNLKTLISSLKQSLPYASRQAYYNDKRRIVELEAELKTLEVRQHRLEEAENGTI